MLDAQIRVAILEDHQSIVDGYKYRLNSVPGFQIVGSARYGDELEALLSRQGVDVLLLDIHVPTSAANPATFPILRTLPALFKKFPALKILAISGLENPPTLIEALIQAGVRGYIFKADQDAIEQLAEIVQMVARGGAYFSQGAFQSLRSNAAQASSSPLTLRQTEILSLCATHPDETTDELAQRLGVASSTVRNLLSEAYFRMDVRSKAAAISKAREMGWLIETEVALPPQNRRKGASLAG